MEECELENDVRENLRTISYVFLFSSLVGCVLGFVCCYFSEYVLAYFEFGIIMFLGAFTGFLGVFNSYRNHSDAIILQIIFNIGFIVSFSIRSAASLLLSINFALGHYKNNNLGIIIPVNITLALIFFSIVSVLALYYIFKLRKNLNSFILFETNNELD